MLGDGAMEKMAVSNVLISGLGGLGVEIGRILPKVLELLIILTLYIMCAYFFIKFYFYILAKNVVLAGVKVLEYV